MTDIVERLRGNPQPGDHVSKLLTEAANEIERLRSEIDIFEIVLAAKKGEIEGMRGIISGLERELDYEKGQP